MAKKNIYPVIISIIIIVLIGSCSASRKANKKCKDCPKFSLIDNSINTRTSVNE